MSAASRKSGVLEVALVGVLLLAANVGLWLFLDMGRTAGRTDVPERLRSAASKLASASGSAPEIASTSTASLSRV